MEFCITVNEKGIIVDKSIKDFKKREQFELVAKSCLGQLIQLCETPSDIKISMIISIYPQNCCICLDKITDPVELNCKCKGKYYHRRCIKEWFKRKKECPTCREKLRGLGYKKSKIRNPYHTNKRQNSPSQFFYKCEGGTHYKQSNFKYLFSALKHAKEKHHINIGFINRRGVQLWYCNHGECTGSGYDFSNEELLSHLQNEHHLNVITSK